MSRSTGQTFQPKQSNHGHKRKGKPVEAWMLELEKAQDQENGSQSLDLTAIKQIADGVEQMVFSWGLDKQEMGYEYAKLSKSLAKENRHVVLPWSLDKTEEGMNSASEMDVLALRNDMKEILENPSPTSTQPQLPTECAVIETRSASSKLAEVKKRENTWLDNFGSCRDRSLSLESASEDPQPWKTRKEHAEAKTYNRFKCETDSCMNATDGVGSCNVQISTGENLLGFETRARENSCQKMTPEHWNIICESIDGGIGESNVASDFCTDASKRGDNPSHANETELRPCLGEGSPIWIEEVAPPTPEGICQQPITNQTRNHYLPSMLTHESAGNASSLLSQSLSCAQSPLPQPEIVQCSEASNERDRLPSSTDPQMCSPINANEPKGSPPPLHFSASNLSCREDTESVEVGGHTIKMTALRGDNDILENKFQTLVNINAGSLGVQFYNRSATLKQEHNQLKPSPTTDVEELQIALLECAMEYEIKNIEAKMKMQELKLKGHQNVAVAKSEQLCPKKAIEPSSTQEVTIDSQRSQQLKKQMAKLQHEKSTLGNELNALKKKERQFEMQKRSLEEALLRVNRLQRCLSLWSQRSFSLCFQRYVTGCAL
ncbi:uncharacterized protein [Physcomitrium patens]|uniref:uncharacterized protein isoform X4 n=1 Tax=Physcomitrium patens TaxID=3218 RepID=UPI000D162D7D|nr:uncharacterized protein LOC112283176 isoform X4 [Physcomitrium patens]|eukprot:XP_024377351.1 uncharacterized protein LOC112283176 isoform X4 [Physcomitrella patens]